MRLKIYSILAVLPILLLVQGCNKYLDQEPDNRTTINSVEKVAQLLVSAYPTSDYYFFTESASDNAEDVGGDAGTADRYTRPYFWEDYEGAGSTTVYWNGAYKGISAANQALEAIETYNLGKAALPYKGEALVARAYAHFMLVTFFSKAYVPGGANDSPGIPYVTVPETNKLKQYDRETVAITYQKIEKDLTEGIQLLMGDAYKVPKFHFTPAAAHAFAVRFYLFKGDWQQVINHASFIDDNGNLLGSLRPVNSTFKDMSLTEFTDIFTSSSLNANLLLATQVSLYQQFTSSAYTADMRYGFGPKLRRMFLTTGNYSGKELANKVQGSSPQFKLNKYREYFYRDNPNIASGLPYLTSPLLTVDETLINRAEAYAQLGQFDNAIQDITSFLRVRINNYNPVTDAPTINKAKAFYGLTDDREAIIKLILESKKAEFLQEGIRWLDILRHRLTVRHNFYNTAGVETFKDMGPDDLRRVFQIPQQSVLAGVALNPR